MKIRGLWPATFLPVEETPRNSEGWKALEDSAAKMQLEQGWQEQRSPSFQCGWTQIFWNSQQLIFNSVFQANAPYNRAQSLNERTWELGDTCEVFLQFGEDPHYLEIHITPNNQRLQLIWTAETFASFQRDPSTLRSHMVTQSTWVDSSVHKSANEWTTRVWIPLSCFGKEATPLNSSSRLKAAVCRYDTTASSDLILSSTAQLKAPSFHRRSEWTPLWLRPRLEV